MNTKSLGIEVKDWGMFLFGAALSGAGLYDTYHLGESGGFLVVIAGLVVAVASLGPTDERMVQKTCDAHLREARDTIDAELARRTRTIDAQMIKLDSTK